MSNDTAKNRPTHRLYRVTKSASGETAWDQIGALWPHKDGKGFNVKLSKPITAGTDLVIRTADRKGGA